MEGWKCPGCGRCYSPMNLQCGYCGPNATLDSTDFIVSSCPGCGKNPCEGRTTACGHTLPLTTGAYVLDAYGVTTPTSGKITFTTLRTGGQ